MTSLSDVMMSPPTRAPPPGSTWTRLRSDIAAPSRGSNQARRPSAPSPARRYHWDHDDSAQFVAALLERCARARGARQGVAHDHLSGRRALSARRAGGRRGAAQPGRGGRLSRPGRPAAASRPTTRVTPTRRATRRGRSCGPSPAAEHVVSISGSCAAMVREGFPRLFAGRPEEAAAAALAARTFEFSRVPGRRSRGGRAAGRAPRHGHHCTTPATRAGCSAWSSSPSVSLQMIEGLEYVPLAHAELCCGFGGTFAVKMPQHLDGHGRREGRSHSRHAAPTWSIGLDTSCLMNIEGRLRRRGHRLEVRHLAEVLAAGWRE